MRIGKKIQFIIAFIALSICLCLMSSTYSRYVSDANGNIDMMFAKWQLLVNENDITNSSSSEISFVPVIEDNINVADNVVAPSSKGYFDITIDPTNVDMSFKYSIAFENINANIPDLKVTSYVVLPENYIEGDPLTLTAIENNTLNNNVLIDKNIENFTFKPFTIRVYFEWYEGTNETMNDESDTQIGVDAANNNIAFSIKAAISFEQII